MPSEKYSQLVNLGRRITDFSIDTEEQETSILTTLKVLLLCLMTMKKNENEEGEDFVPFPI